MSVTKAILITELNVQLIVHDQCAGNCEKFSEYLKNILSYQFLSKSNLLKNKILNFLPIIKTLNNGT